MPVIPILHFNDVYRVSPQKIGKSGGEVDVTQFAALVHELKGRWKTRDDGWKDGLVLFSGDLFSPSIESSVTRGSHMVPVMNEIGVDIALTGNHDFDFGYPHLTTLVKDSKYPWILSNIIDTRTNGVPEHLHLFQVAERCGVRIGIVGLVEEEWITTISSWPPEFQYKDMAETGRELSKLLRDPSGEYRCDIIIALTHCRLPNDLALARTLLALSPSARKSHPIINEHGVDILLGGHDHLYFVCKGAGEWENYDNTQPVLGAETDNGDVFVLKSGTDFRDVSQIQLELEDTPEGSVRRKVIKNLTGERHTIQPNMESSASLTQILKNILSSVSSAMQAPVCRTTTSLDLRSSVIRTSEAAAPNWFADVIRHAYDDAPRLKGSGGADAVFICAGALRGDSIYDPGIIHLGDILEILPFDDPVVVLELDGETIWTALEVALGSWPAQEGRFPVISGMKVTWDSRRPSGQRVIDVSLLRSTEKHNDEGSPERMGEDEPIFRRPGGRKYKIVTRDYLAQGRDGFDCLKGKPYLVDHESGCIMSSIMRRYLLGSQFVHKMMGLTAEQRPAQLSKNTHVAISDALKEQTKRSQAHVNDKAAGRWKKAIDDVIHQARSQKHYRGVFNVSTTEHMSPIEPFNGSVLRSGQECTLRTRNEFDKDLLVISPQIDGRLKNMGKAPP